MGKKSFAEVVVGQAWVFIINPSAFSRVEIIQMIFGISLIAQNMQNIPLIAFRCLANVILAPSLAAGFRAPNPPQA
ncbi:MAG TPA: hypothetical protein VHD56_02045, partial [Tepidisphaeraceae bacterium]|nr:hypothetical protein [Tepidisphaeraceae bacterium]